MEYRQLRKVFEHKKLTVIKVESLKEEGELIGKKEPPYNSDLYEVIRSGELKNLMKKGKEVVLIT